MIDWIVTTTDWMYWTIPSGIFFGGLFLTIAGMGVWDHYSPNVNRKGFLPVETSRGDRLFIGIISIIAFLLLWLTIFNGRFLWGFVILSAAWFFVEAKWG